MRQEYDIIIVGAGHAGCEAAAAAATMGSKVLLITMDLTRMAQMSCNPAMGGIAKGQIVREIDALGGLSGIVTDNTMIQFRMLNRSKGPAMWSPRSQNDRTLFSWTWRTMLEKIPNLDMRQDMVKEIIVVEKGGRLKATGVITMLGNEIHSKAVILTNGTFLNGIIHIGEKNFTGGRIGEKPAEGLTENLRQYGFTNDRFKTGTPPRVDGRSLDYLKMEEQKGDDPPSKFSFIPGTSPFEKNTSLPKGGGVGGGVQKSCWIAYTNSEVHDLLRTGFDKSPMFSGRIKGTGPRYCPSIEDKIDRFAGKNRHQLFIEPEGWDTVEVYVNGFSTSLPEDVQEKALRKIAGFENVKMFRPGYAIEYDYFPPHQLHHTLETKLVENLWFAGQINGTTGYEEAACQGLMAGINAHLSARGGSTSGGKTNNKDSFILGRDEAYIGVLIDDLVTKGTEEPYRMFTSRAEFRLSLRQDNADVRLTPKSHALGLAGDDRMKQVEKKIRDTDKILEYFRSESVSPSEANKILEDAGSEPVTRKIKLVNILARPNVNNSILKKHLPGLQQLTEDDNCSSDGALFQAEILLKYDGYLAREKEMADKMNRLEYVKIPAGFDFVKIKGLSNEARQKFAKFKPETLGHASRISGVSPADVSVLMVYLGR
ncbi:MAG: tRNA uridine-5-carboxymethylaminomethyl(34) synthesis enzyme MnmG [Bacteroidetes bacterium]|nr:tRNA uridine-5-carboxymethylaminomethyl(34) synthesis enzyme MnmG [Bacteroidota bacterium]